MGNHMYWITALTFALVLLIIIIEEKRILKERTKYERSFHLMLAYTFFFCLQDVLWGMCDSGVIKNDIVFFLSSSLFHTSTVITTFFWLKYVLGYLDDHVKRKKLYLFVDSIVIMMQLTLVIANFFRPVIFTIENGIYVTQFLRPVAFFDQYIVYLVMGIATFFCAHSVEKEYRQKYYTVFWFALAPILTGIFQFLYPDAPFYSLGYFLGCFIVHAFIVSKERNEAAQEMLKKSTIDQLTGLYNRRAYEEDMRDLSDNCKELVYISADINGLKAANDTYGHAAGDELLLGAANCMKRCFEPYGKIYRIGGDEFAIILFVTEEKALEIKKKFEDELSNWKGRLIESVHVSCGYVLKNENLSAIEIAKMADERMYRDKALFYQRQGVDRRGQYEAHKALCASYTKILKIDITKDCFTSINMDTDEMTQEKGYSQHISEWLAEFGKCGCVHADDLEEYLSKTNIDYMREFFKQNKNSLVIIYRRQYEDAFKRVMMEIIPAGDYTDDNQQLFLYVKKIEA